MRSTPDLITRREALARAAALLGGMVSSSTVAGVLAGCHRQRGEAGAGTGAFRPETLTPEQNELVIALSDHILPETDTPGAKAARANEFVDAMLTHYYPAVERQRFLNGLGRVNARAQRAHGKPFVDCTPEQQLAMLRALDRQAYEDALAPENAAAASGAAARDPVTQQGDNATGRSHDDDGVGASGAVAVDGKSDPEDVGKEAFFRTMKELTLVGYYTSELGSTQELRLNPMGRYRGDVPLDEIGRAWA